MIRLYTAKYDGECSFCFAEIYEGDEYGWVDGEFACPECVEGDEL